MDKFGGCCVKCGCKERDILQFDHKNNDGFKVRSHYSDRYKFYLAGEQDVQLLCPNCHQLKMKGF